jgi:hypothetical protein
MRPTPLRRHHERRAKRRAAKSSAAPSTARMIGILARTPCKCSCLMCGNERRHAGPTMQERRAADRQREASA